MNYGYARVSTSKQNLNDQIDQLKKAGIDSDNIFSEKYTGTKTDRPEFQKLLGVLGADDSLTVVKLDRLARNLLEALEVIKDLHDKDVQIKVLNPKMTITNDMGGKIMYQTLLMVADIERDMIVSRTQEGKRYAKENNPNFRDGRPKRAPEGSVHGIKYKVIYERAKATSVRKTARDLGVSPSTVTRVKRLFKGTDGE